MSDIFIPVEGDGVDNSGGPQVERMLSLLFADPEAPGPTTEEFGMQVAAQAATRSPELGLRVGAAVLTPDAHVLATGRNHHPSADESPAYDAGVVDLRHMLSNLLSLIVDEKMLKKAVAAKLDADPETYVRELLAGPLKKAQLRDITEYQRPVHAEMDALLSMLRQRVAIDRARVYVTAYPCHNCGKHLIAAGLDVVYLEPYAKSRIASMYAEHLDKFRPFSGVAPRRYQAWFIDAKQADRKDTVGAALAWSSDDRRAANPSVAAGMNLGSVIHREDLARRS